MTIPIRIIAAISLHDDGVGISTSIPWRQKADMRRFAQLTREDGIIVMGRTTWESFHGRILAGRIHIVITTRPILSSHPDVHFVASFKQAIALARSIPDRKGISLIGGRRIWQDGLALADKLSLTYIDVPKGKIPYDTFFPVSKEAIEKQWIKGEQQDHPANDENEYAYSYIEYWKR